MVGGRKTSGRRPQPRTCKHSIPEIEDIVGNDVATHRFDLREASLIRSSLLSWYDSNHRILPWRTNLFSKVDNARGGNEHGQEETQEAKAYAVWVSEMMLQQTRVATVVQYYQRWMEKWPTLHHLAQASQEEVNALWAGLGYYRRARFLLEGAKHIAEANGGAFPSSVPELQKIPGIGNYTAGAIASIAFNQPVPVVDGNVVRVICRLRAISVNPKASTSIKLFWALAEQLVDAQRPGDLNQSLMELGATICSPTSPSCAVCPVASQCRALALAAVGPSGEPIRSVTDFPVKVAKAAPRNEYVAVCVVERIPQGSSHLGRKDSSFLLVRRPDQGLLAGLWEFPSAILDKLEKSSTVRIEKMNQYLKKKLGMVIGEGSYKVLARKDIGANIHIFSHIKLHMHVEWLLLEEWVREEDTEQHHESCVKWIHASKVKDSGLTSGVKKVFEMFLDFRREQEHLSGATRASKRRKKEP